MKKQDTDIKKLRELFIGSSISSKILLKKSIDLKLNLVGVCTKRKSNNLDFCNLKQEFKDLKTKLKLTRIYKSEIKKHPFPRSLEEIKALAVLRGSESGYKYAESFKLILKKND